MEVCVKKMIGLFGALPLMVLAAGDIEDSLLLETVVNAKPLERIHPKYPVLAAKSGKEGWVRLSYVIRADGSVDNLIVEDSSGERDFEREAMRAIRQWTYEPAVQDGKPIEQCQNKVQMDFALQKGPEGVTRRFLSRARKIQDALENGQLDAARVQLDLIKDSPKWNLYEDAWYWMLDARYQEHKGNEKAELVSIGRALMSERLPEPNRLYLAQRRFQLEVASNRLADALETFERIEQLDQDGEVTAVLRPYAKQLRQILDGEELVVVDGNIGQRLTWQHKLSRSQFSLVDNEGDLESVEVRCQNQYSTYKAVTDVIWKIPPAWGQCSVYLRGEENASFKLLELPQNHDAHLGQI
ncbi:hypothetical protein GCM10027098_28240 [Bowmanella dokdonensis]